MHLGGFFISAEIFHVGINTLSLGRTIGKTNLYDISVTYVFKRK